jgi:hypothetical protein
MHTRIFCYSLSESRCSEHGLASIAQKNAESVRGSIRSIKGRAPRSRHLSTDSLYEPAAAGLPRARRVDPATTVVASSPSPSWPPRLVIVASLHLALIVATPAPRSSLALMALAIVVVVVAVLAGGTPSSGGTRSHSCSSPVVDPTSAAADASTRVLVRAQCVCPYSCRSRDARCCTSPGQATPGLLHVCYS